MSSRNEKVWSRQASKLRSARVFLISLGRSAVRRFRSIVDAVGSESPESTGQELSEQQNAARILLAMDSSIFNSGSVLRYPLNGRMPEDIRLLNLDQVSDILSAASIMWFVVRNDSKTRYTIAVMEKDRTRCLEALCEGLKNSAVYVASSDPDATMYLTSTILLKPELVEADTLRIGSFFQDSLTDYKIGWAYSCDVEFWSRDPENPEKFLAPRRNAAAQILTRSELEPATVVLGGRAYPTSAIFKERMIDDIHFPIDAVYTWVDGTDPEWIESKQKFQAAVDGEKYHPEAHHEARFRSRDELKYSLRSLEMYAPWFRQVILVTSGQVPEWLNTAHPKLRIVSHNEIFEDPAHLPTFNSNSIISRLHHIPGLSENYVYINDDVFFGRTVSPNQFFLPNGIAKVSPASNRRPFGDSIVSDEPHINLTRNIRQLLRSEFGITVSRAIRHTPHPQVRSVHYEMENRFNEYYAQTWGSHFRHHSNIVADQLFHYYAQITGKAVPGNLRYEYINVLDNNDEEKLSNTLKRRDRDVFCLNDAPAEGVEPFPDEKITDFLTSYFPVQSSFELIVPVNN